MVTLHVFSMKFQLFTQDKKIVISATQPSFHLELSSIVAQKALLAEMKRCRKTFIYSSCLGHKHGIKNSQAMALQFSLYDLGPVTSF